MEKHCLSVLETNVSKLGFGCMRFPTLENGKIDREQSAKMLDYAYQNGVEYYDTAWGYHDEESQYFVGEAMSKYPRDSFYLATKMPCWNMSETNTPQYYFEEQQARCRTDYFDYYLVHSLNKSHIEKMEKYHVYEYLKQKQEEGAIRHLGFSFHGSMEDLRYLLDNYQWDFVQLQVNYLDFDYPMSRADEEYALVTQHNLPIIVMEPIRGGFLANPPKRAEQLMQAQDPARSASSWALRWCRNLDNVALILSGMSKMEHVVDNIETFQDGTPLTQAEEEMLDQVAKSILSVDMVPCTACRYCMDCPFGVDIPGNFTLYNNATVFERVEDSKKNLAQFKEERKDYSVCTQCGVCMPQCPQNIQIPDELARIGALVEKM